ncbi:glycosyltransferase [Pseudonocardia sp. ICBG1293]|uniref:glycosyltransferase n=1 Tax=Pseudonocardia sp. ICBG1293 TaxID=2844382 RepID=UPI001CCD119D|nr:glycosyltransferase [Pseudonocardia sp. ICBG1293]
MRVLHVITGLDAGGAERQLRLLLRHRRAETEVVALGNPGVVADGLRADGVPVHLVPMSGNTDLSALPALVRLIRRGRFDVVHTHLYRACVYGRLAARLAGVRTVVATEHSLNGTLIEGRPVDRPGVRGLYVATERLGRTTVAVSQEVADRLRGWGVPDRRITLLRNGTDVAGHRFDAADRERVRRRYAVAADRPVVGVVGRLEPPKRVGVLLDALPALPGVTALVVGHGSARAALERHARGSGVADRVVFTGEVDDVAAHLGAMDVLASPAPEETFGLALLEAAASGLPVAYASGPVLDQLDDPRHLRVASDPGAVAVAVASLLHRPPDRRPAAGLDRFDVVHVAAELDALYRRLAARDPMPRKALT